MKNIKFCFKFFLLYSLVNLVLPSFAADTWVKGWPNYLAMGTISNGVPQMEPTDIKVDAIFTYNGNSGNGDPGKIEPPSKIFNMLNMAEAIIHNPESNTKKINPVIVEYQWNLSGGWQTEDVTNEDYLTRHLFNLMVLARLLEDYGPAKTGGTSGTILLNPDLLGFIANTSRQAEAASLQIRVNVALQEAYCMINRSDFDFSHCESEGKIDYHGDVLGLLMYLRSKTDPYDASQRFAACVESVALPFCKGRAGFKIPPQLSDNFKGWIQAQNWIIKYFGPHVAFGWHENISAIPGGSWWIHTNQDQAIASFVKSVLNDLAFFEVFSGAYRPDFIYLDRYGADDYVDNFPTLVRDQGTFYNDKTWDNILTLAKAISEGLGQSSTGGLNFVPVMLWQIPAAHIPTQSESKPEILTEGSAPDYFLGDASLKGDLSNIAPWLDKKIGILPSYYGVCAGLRPTQCLTLYQFDWSHQDKVQLKRAVDSHVFSILWGAGGYATGIWAIPGLTFEDNGWMSNAIKNYYTKQLMPLNKN